MADTELDADGQGGSLTTILGTDSELAATFGALAATLHGLFDSEWYRRSYGDIASSGLGPFSHFLLIGMGERRSPSPLFENGLSYLDAGEARAGVSSPLLDYIISGWKLHRNVHPLVNTAWYLSQLEMRGIPAAEPASHYRTIGWKLGLSPHPLFDTNYYLRENAIALGFGEDPLTHYLKKGWLAGYGTSRDFDADWYLAAYPDVREDGKDPLLHYLVYGYKEGRNPSPLFSTSEYLEINDDVKEALLDPLTHYLVYGESEGRTLPRGLMYDRVNGFTVDPIELDVIPQTPLVSIIVANLNGARHLDDLFASLRVQSYTNFEVVFVDDGSTDDSVERARALGADTIVTLPAQTGFAGANNAGLAAARGELLALLNNDTRVQEFWLESMVLRMKADQKIGAVTSRVRFWSRFDRVLLLGPREFEVDRSELLSSISYKKIFVRQGIQQAQTIASVRINSGSYGIEIDVPRCYMELLIPVSEDTVTSMSVRINGSLQKTHAVRTTTGNLSLAIKKEHLDARRDPGFYIINNVGSGANEQGMPFDRGMAEVDVGQYDVAAQVPFFCGCSVLIRRNALRGKNLFINDFVAYFEDSELSHRLTSSGYNIVYEPNSIVYHKHSSTTVEHSAFWRTHTAKNSILFNYILNEAKNERIIEEGLLHLNHLQNWYTTAENVSADERTFAQNIPGLSKQIVELSAQIRDGSVPARSGIRIGVFNPYWSTLGGGEAHALNVAYFFTGFGFVELISIIDFDLKEVCRYFGVRSDKFIKRLVKEMTTGVTADYDYFINACYKSGLASQAARSFYVVSFPQRNARLEFLRGYTFLANSQYTQRWMTNFWGADNFTSEVLYPVVDERFFVNASTPVAKEPMMLSVGRFVSTGHTKNQLEIAEAFRSAVSLGLVSTTWKLVLIGSANDRRYLERVEEALLGMNYEIIIDADFDVVVDRYRRAAIYVHASGLGVSEDDAPELFEHFGMAVAQGAGSGCVPIVFGAAGPAEIIRDIGIGYTYSSVFELVELLGDVTGKYDRGDFDRGLYQSLPSAVRVYSEEAFRRQLTSVIGDASEVAIPQEYPAPHPRDNESIVRNGGAPSVPKVNASPARRSRRK